MPLLEVRNVSKSFGAIRALSDVSFAIESGEVVGGWNSPSSILGLAAIACLHAFRGRTRCLPRLSPPV